MAESKMTKYAETIDWYAQNPDLNVGLITRVLPDEDKSQTALQAHNGTNGWRLLMGQAGNVQVYKTTDGGENWTLDTSRTYSKAADIPNNDTNFATNGSLKNACRYATQSLSVNTGSFPGTTLTIWVYGRIAVLSGTIKNGTTTGSALLVAAVPTAAYYPVASVWLSCDRLTNANEVTAEAQVDTGGKLYIWIPTNLTNAQFKVSGTWVTAG